MGVWRVKELVELKRNNNYDINKDNFIDFPSKEIILNQFKTVKQIGYVYEVIPPKLLKILSIYASMPHKTDYLLETSQGKKVTNRFITSILQEQFGCSANILRHSWTTWLDEQGKLKTTVQIKKNAKQMRHSVEQTLQYRLRKPEEVSAEEDEEEDE